MKNVILFLVLLSPTAAVFAACPQDPGINADREICIVYTEPTMNVDGTLIADTVALDYVTIFWGMHSGVYEANTIQVPAGSGHFDATDGLGLSDTFSGNLFFAMTATNLDGQESVKSAEAQFFMPPAVFVPQPPVIQSVSIQPN